MTVTISRWGNSLAVRIPKDALEAAGFHEGDVLNVVSERGQLILAPAAAPPTLDELIGMITPENTHSPVFDSIVGAEGW